MFLTLDEAHNLDFYYEQAQDYPVDLYYLMDLSKSMEDDKEKLETLKKLHDGLRIKGSQVKTTNRKEYKKIVAQALETEKTFKRVKKEKAITERHLKEFDFMKG